MPPVEYVRYGIWLVVLLSLSDAARRTYLRWRLYENFIHLGAEPISRREHIRHAKIVGRFVLASVMTGRNLFLLGVYSGLVVHLALLG